MIMTGWYNLLLNPEQNEEDASILIGPYALMPIISLLNQQWPTLQLSRLMKTGSYAKVGSHGNVVCAYRWPSSGEFDGHIV